MTCHRAAIWGTAAAVPWDCVEVSRLCQGQLWVTWFVTGALRWHVPKTSVRTSGMQLECGSGPGAGALISFSNERFSISMPIFKSPTLLSSVTLKAVYQGACGNAIVHSVHKNKN